MKKTIHILFLAIFTAITLGFTVNKHYSGGELFSFALFGKPESCCDDVCDCCDEESETIQFLVDYIFSTENPESLPVEVELKVFALTIDVWEPEILLAETSFFDQDLPPPDNLTRLSYIQTFLL